MPVTRTAAPDAMSSPSVIPTRRSPSISTAPLGRSASSAAPSRSSSRRSAAPMNASDFPPPRPSAQSSAMKPSVTPANTPITHWLISSGSSSAVGSGNSSPNSRKPANSQQITAPIPAQPKPSSCDSSNSSAQPATSSNTPVRLAGSSPMPKKPSTSPSTPITPGPKLPGSRIS